MEILKPIVLLTERFSLHAELKLEQSELIQLKKVDKLSNCPIELSQDAEALIIRSQTLINEKTLERFPKLKLIVTGTVGFNHINLKDTQKKGITVCHCPRAHTASATELTWSLILSLSKKLHRAQKQMQAGDWNREPLMGLELKGQTIGVVGLGRIGSSVAKVAQSFGMTVVAHDPYQKDEVFQELNLERLSLEEVLRSSQIVTLHVPLTRETHHMMGEMYIDSMRDHALLINTCRGPVIHEQALIKALDKGKLAGAGLDVFEYEPLPRDSQLLKMSHVVLTPHIGATTDQAFNHASLEAAEKVIRFFSQLELKDQLPGQEEWFKFL